MTDTQHITIQDRVKSFLKFNKQLALVLFLPLLLYFELLAVQTFVLTVACNATGYGCIGAVSIDKVVSIYAGAMMSLQGSDEFVPNDKRRAAR